MVEGVWSTRAADTELILCRTCDSSSPSWKVSTLRDILKDIFIKCLV